MIERVPPNRRLRICVVGDLDGIHTQNWMRYFVERGHDVHGVSYYTPFRPPEGVRVHALRPAATGGGHPAASGARPGFASRLPPPALLRLANLLRYRRAGLHRVVENIEPDILHAHYLVEHGLYATSANFRPYVVSAWGSDVLVDAVTSPFSRAIARFVLRRTSLATANNRHMAREMVLNLGAEPGSVQHIVLGVQRDLLVDAPASVNEKPPQPDRMPTIVSSRSLDTPLYNIDTIIRAMARVRKAVPTARLVITGSGRLRPQLEDLAHQTGVGDAVCFDGSLSQEDLRDAFADAEVFVSVPSSDGTSVALLQAMAAGCFPVVSDLASQHELVEDGVTGLRVPVRDEAALADAVIRSLEEHDLRSSAIERNRAFVEEYGMLDANMAKMEAWYYRLANRAADAGFDEPA